MLASDSTAKRWGTQKMKLSSKHRLEKDVASILLLYIHKEQWTPTVADVRQMPIVWSFLQLIPQIVTTVLGSCPAFPSANLSYASL